MSSTASGGHNAAPPQIVSKFALEGKARNNEANVKLYLKLSIPAGQATPAAAIPLFPENSAKIVNSVVHPLDSHDVPYSFSSSTLIQASRSLNLPNRSSKSYKSLFPQLGHDRPLDDKLTGHISVVDYQVSYVLPKELPPVYSSGIRDGDESFPRGRSFFDRNVYQFMAAIEIYLPFYSAPPKAPYMLSIPTPKCLSNTVKLHIQPPSPALWNVSTTPPVAPRPPSSPKSVSSSVSSSILSETDDVVISGTFPSTNTFVIRFARHDDDRPAHPGRRRAAVSKVVAVTQWTILERNDSVLKAALSCQLTLQNIWHAGVEALLALDAALQSQENCVEWAPGQLSGWTIKGPPGLTGHEAVGLILSDRPTPGFEPSTSNLREAASTPSPGSGSSLLRTPLPNPTDIPSFSFEGQGPERTYSEGSSSSLITPSATPSRLPSSFYTDTDMENGRTPCSPISLHFSMNDLGPSLNNKMDCTIEGTVLLSASNDGEIALPMFKIETAEGHHGDILLQTHVNNLSWLSVRAREPVPLKESFNQRASEGTVLFLGTSESKGSTELVKRSASSAPIRNVVPSPKREGSSTPVQVIKSTSPNAAPNSPSVETVFIPHAQVTVTPLPSSNLRHSCAVRLRFSLSLTRHRYLEFGLATSETHATYPDIELVYATLGNAVVHPEVFPGSDYPPSPLRSEKAVLDQWACWMRIDLMGLAHQPDHLSKNELEILYLVHVRSDKQKYTDAEAELLHPLLPCFAAKIGLLDVQVEEVFGWQIRVDHTNLVIGRTEFKLSSYTLQPYFTPALRLCVRNRRRYSSAWVERLICLVIGGLLFSVFHTARLFQGCNSLDNVTAREIATTAAVASWTTARTPFTSPTTMVSIYSSTTSASSGTALAANTTARPSDTSTAPPYDLMLRINAVTSLVAMRAHRFYNHETKLFYNTFRQSLAQVWNICRRAFHFPLNPDND